MEITFGRSDFPLQCLKVGKLLMWINHFVTAFCIVNIGNNYMNRSQTPRKIHASSLLVYQYTETHHSIPQLSMEILCLNFHCFFTTKTRGKKLRLVII